MSGVDLGRDAASRRVGALHHGAIRYAGAVALAALAYYGAGRVGLELAYLDGAVAALWPPAGLGLAVLFLYGIRLWPGIVVGDLLLADFSTPLGTVLAQTFGNTVALVVAALLLRRLTRGRGRWSASRTCWRWSRVRWSPRLSARRSGRCRCAWAT